MVYLLNTYLSIAIITISKWAWPLLPQGNHLHWFYVLLITSVHLSLTLSLVFRKDGYNQVQSRLGGHFHCFLHSFYCRLKTVLGHFRVCIKSRRWENFQAPTQIFNISWKVCLIGIHNYQTYTYLHVLYVNDSLGNVNIGLIPRPLFPTPRWPGYEATCMLLCVQTSLTEAQLANSSVPRPFSGRSRMIKRKRRVRWITQP